MVCGRLAPSDVSTLLAEWARLGELADIAAASVDYSWARVIIDQAPDECVRAWLVVLEHVAQRSRLVEEILGAAGTVAPAPHARKIAVAALEKIQPYLAT